MENKNKEEENDDDNMYIKYEFENFYDENHHHCLNEKNLKKCKNHKQNGLWWLKNLCNAYILEKNYHLKFTTIPFKSLILFLIDLYDDIQYHETAERKWIIETILTTVEIFGGKELWHINLYDWLKKNKNQINLIPCQIEI